MKDRFASFLVKRSKTILITFIVLAVGFGVLIPFVNINYDMTKYLPKDSSMKKGLDVMEAEFGKEESSDLQIMFNDLKSQDQKDKICRELEDIRYVESVDYEADSKDYNKGTHTLFILNCDRDKHSDQAAYIWKTVKDRYEDSHDINLGGEIRNGNESGLPVWIVALAVAFITLILLIMANSYIEPVAFLITIAVAVLINMGSYIFFPSISNTTFGIVAILQLALSMDYSIMLLNRYRQQRLVIPDKHEAMVSSLSLSFGAITGSSLTTFAGLLALVFMSFTMGRDIGFALAKGVIISLICIFTVLPSLLLGFDNLMKRTAKKTVPSDFPKLSSFHHRFRIPITILFALIFAGSFIAKSGVDFSYSQTNPTEIDKVFGSSNSIVLVYDNEDGAKAAQLADKLSDDSRITSAVCYEGTLGKDRSATAMRSFIDDMADSETDMDISTDMIRLIYYDYFAGDDEITMSIPQFVSFLRNDVMNNETFGDEIDDDMRSSIDQMAKFTDVKALTKSMNASELAGFFVMKKSQAEQLLLYYNIRKGKGNPQAMSLPDFVNFLINDVSKDRQYKNMFDAATMQQLKNMQIYTDKTSMTTPVTYQAAAQMLGMSEEQMLQIYGYYIQLQEGETPVSDPTTYTLSVQTVVNFIISDENMRGSMDAQQLGQLEQLAAIINLSVSGKKLSSADMAKVFGMKSGDVRSIYLLKMYKSGKTSGWKLSPQGFVNFLVKDVLSDKSMKKQIGGSTDELRTAQKIINWSVAGTQFTAAGLSDALSSLSGVAGGSTADMDEGTISLLYKYYGSVTKYDSTWAMNICTMVHHLNDSIITDKAYESVIDSGMRKDVRDMTDELDDAAALLEGKDYGRMLITADMVEDSDETRAFMKNLTADCDAFAGDYYLIGNTPMAYEMSKSFGRELNKITLITALFIFIIVLLTFRTLATPVILVLIIQCAVFVTMAVMNVINYDMNYLALMIVQSIMMGATIDYAIIYSTYYIENRALMPPKEAIRAAYKGSLQTILTSALILIVAVGILSFAFSEMATRQICRILSAGCLTATLLVIFVLPAILACLDRFVVPGRKT